MITRFPGTCACGCLARYKAGADVTRTPVGWVLTSCASRRTPKPAPTGSFAASIAEILEILARARVVAARADAEAKAFAAKSSTLPPGLAGGSRPGAVGSGAGSSF